MAAQNLRVVAPCETAPKRKPKTVTQAADNGTRLELLRAMRTRVATAVENPNTPARDLAALTRRLLEIAKDIELLEGAAEQEDASSDPAGDEDDAFDSSSI